MNSNSLLDEWEIIGKLGRGLLSTVYKVRKKDNSSIEAVIKRTSNTSIVKSDFKSKLQLLKLVTQLSSISQEEGLLPWKDVKVTDADQHTYIEILMDYYCPFMEYYQNHHLTEVNVIELGIDICKALKTLEKHEVIHGDIKPSNIFINEDNHFVLGDLDTAIEKANYNQSRHLMGTLAYAAPEVLIHRTQNENINGIDIYSLGIVLYRLTHNGMLPFQKDQERSSLEAAIQIRLIQEGALKPNTGNSALNEVIIKATHPQPGMRYHDAFEMTKGLLRAKEIAANKIKGYSLENLYSQYHDEINHSVPASTKQIPHFFKLDQLSEMSNEELFKTLESTVGIIGQRGKDGDWKAFEHLIDISVLTERALSDSLRRDLNIICRKLIEYPSHTSDTDENILNDYVRDMLSQKETKYIVKDQTRQGVGELDLHVIKDEKEIAIIEAMRLASVNEGKLRDHLNRLLIGYDPAGTYIHFLLIYYTGSNFASFFEKLVNWFNSVTLQNIQNKDTYVHYSNAGLREIAVQIEREGVSELLVVIVMCMRKPSKK